MFRIAKHAVDLNKNSSFFLEHTLELQAGPALEEGPVEVVYEAPPEPVVPEPNPDIEKARAEAEALAEEARVALERAREQAKKIIDKANGEAEALRTAAKAEGYAEGYAVGRVESGRRAENETQALLDTEREEFAGLMREFSERRGSMFDNMELHVLQLSLAIGEKIVRDALDRDDEAFQTLVRAAIEQLRNIDRITVRVSPEDYARYYAAGSFMLELNDDSVRVLAVEDSALTRGSCIVETADEMIDASIRTQLNIIREAFNQGSPERTKVSL